MYAVGRELDKVDNLTHRNEGRISSCGGPDTGWNQLHIL